jgi:hypothetical protein
MLEKLLDGKNWFPVVLPVTALVAFAFVVIASRRRVPATLIVGVGLAVFVGLFIGILATGHVFAITTKMMLGTLPPRIDPWFALPFGLAMAAPGYGLAWLASRSLWRRDGDASTRTSETMEA